MNIKIGDTPLIELTKEVRALKGVRIFAKLEGENAGGSIKSRVALAMIEDAEEKGLLRCGGEVAEATSGNTGVGLALLAKEKGYKARIFLPENLQGERSARIEGYGGVVALTPACEGMRGAVERAKAYAENTPNCFYADQFHNPVCATVHYQTTGEEIWAQTKGEVDVLVAGVGTGGTLTGVARCLKEKKPTVRAVGVEPARSPLLSKGWAGAHGIRGIGANFVSSILDRGVMDEVILATDEGAAICASWLKKRLGLAVGISSGAAFFACLSLACRAELQGKNIVVIFPDKAEP